MQPVHESDFGERVLGAKAPVLVLFTRPGCHACAVAKDQVRAIHDAYDGRFLLHTVDTSVNPALREKYVNGGLPVTVLFHDGGEVWRRTGAGLTKEKIAVFLDELL